MDRVCHFEVPYSNKQRMEKFYSEVFGWQPVRLIPDSCLRRVICLIHS